MTVPTGLEQKLFGTPVTYEPLDVRAANQWWSGQSEPDRKSVIGHVKGAVEYGLTVTYQQMPEAAKTAMLDAYARFLGRKCKACKGSGLGNETLGIKCDVCNGTGETL